MNESHAKVEQLLAEVVTVKTKGAATTARPGQLQLAFDIMDRLNAARTGGPAEETQLAGEAPTGVGKSFALLGAAFVDAAEHGRRTVISTQQKVLQNQIVDIDAPDMQAAAKNLGLPEIGVAVLKGWRSYLCLQKAEETAAALKGGTETWSEFRTRTEVIPSPAAEVVVDGVTYDGEAVGHALDWALGGHDTDSPSYGDMDSYRSPAAMKSKAGGTLADAADLITIAKEDCLSESCPFWDNGCAPQNSRAVAQSAHVVVTNHALLGIQAALGVPTVFGNKLLGDFDNLMVDEAHDLADEVRTRGTQHFSAPSLRQAADRIDAFTEEAARANVYLLDTVYAGQESAKTTIRELEAVADYLRAHEAGVADAFKEFIATDPEQVAEGKLPGPQSYDHGHALDELGVGIVERLEHAVTALKRTAESGDAFVQRSAESESCRWPAVSACESLAGKLGRFISKGPRRIDATWVEAKTAAGQLHGEGHVAPLNVASRIRTRLWRNAATNTPRASIAVSATMPENFVRSCGMEAEVGCFEYESPYASAYSNTALFVPRLGADEINRLTVPATDENPRASFNHKEHPYWASSYIGGLVRANRGAALVLAATRGAGEHYAFHLRRSFPNLVVLDQWSTNKEDAIKEWKDDESSVLVGTRSLMTGVDAYGPTNSLVIVDKIGRSPEEPLLKSLVTHLAPSLGWETAVNEVYVVPGANLLKQSGGRLVRRETDAGMFAVLEPRFHKANSAIPGHFGKNAKALHKRAVKSFGQRIYDYDKALDFLEAQSASRPQLSRTASTAA